MAKAKNLTDMVRVFDPVQPLSGTELTEFYVDRQSESLAQMETRLRVARKDEPIKLLFTGQRGCGKSTELASSPTICGGIILSFLFCSTPALAYGGADLLRFDLGHGIGSVSPSHRATNHYKRPRSNFR